MTPEQQVNIARNMQTLYSENVVPVSQVTPSNITFSVGDIYIQKANNVDDLANAIVRGDLGRIVTQKLGKKSW